MSPLFSITQVYEKIAENSIEQKEKFVSESGIWGISSKIANVHLCCCLVTVLPVIFRYAANYLDNYCFCANTYEDMYGVFEVGSSLTPPNQVGALQCTSASNDSYAVVYLTNLTTDVSLYVDSKYVAL